MRKRYQIFVSSTYEDLKIERRKVQDIILKMKHFPIGMEMFGATDKSQWEIIKKTIDESDYYILIIGHRYGSMFDMGKDEGISYTEKEFRYALDKGIPILAFIVNEKVNVMPSDIAECAEKRYKLERFRQLVESGKSVEYWTNADDLASVVSASLKNCMEENERLGWVRNSVVNKQRIGNNRVTEFGIKQISLEELFKQAQKSIFLYGNTLIALNNMGYSLKDILEKGIEVKLLTMDILDENYERNCNFFGSSVERMRTSSICSFYRMEELGIRQSKNLQVKVSSMPIAIGIVAIDLEEDNGMIIASHLMYGCPTHNSLIAKICRDSDFYERYKLYIERCWRDNVHEVDEHYLKLLLP